MQSSRLGERVLTRLVKTSPSYVAILPGDMHGCVKCFHERLPPTPEGLVKRAGNVDPKVFRRNDHEEISTHCKLCAAEVAERMSTKFEEYGV